MCNFSRFWFPPPPLSLCIPMHCRDHAWPVVGWDKVALEQFVKVERFRPKYHFAQNIISPKISFRPKYHFAQNIISPKISFRPKYHFAQNIISPKILFRPKYYFAQNIISPKITYLPTYPRIKFWPWRRGIVVKASASRKIQGSNPALCEVFGT
jgi:hypothetical protein